MFEAYLVTLLGVMAAQIAPGPNLVAVASTALGDGRRPAVFVVAGIAIGMLAWAFSTALGLAALLDQYPFSMILLRFVGGGYLLWLAFKALRSVIRGTPATIRADTSEFSDLMAFRRGLFVVLTNPKAALMWAAVATFLFGANLSAWQVLGFAPVGATSGFVIYGLYACLFSTNAAHKGYSRAARSVEGLFAGAFGAMGGKLIYDGVRELRS